MNITLDDGRTELWQWDTGRKIIVDDKSVSEVHYSKYSSTQAITREVINGKAEIPNFLLQDTHAVTAYAYSGSIENGYTIAEKTFNVLKKPKPANYVETEEDKAILSKLKEEIGDLSELQTEAKDNLVAAINEAAASGGSDWAQNDPTAKDYIKNRPGGYDIVTPEKIISEWRMAGSNYATIELSEPLVKGRSYRLTFSENADYSNPVFDSEVVASIDDSNDSIHKGNIYVTVKGYASVTQPVTYPEDPATYSCNNDVRSGYCRLIALANTETVKIPDKYTNAITYTPQILTDKEKQLVRSKIESQQNLVYEAGDALAVIDEDSMLTNFVFPNNLRVHIDFGSTSYGPYSFKVNSDGSFSIDYDISHEYKHVLVDKSFTPVVSSIGNNWYKITAKLHRSIPSESGSERPASGGVIITNRAINLLDCILPAHVVTANEYDVLPMDAGFTSLAIFKNLDPHANDDYVEGVIMYCNSDTISRGLVFCHNESGYMVAEAGSFDAYDGHPDDGPYIIQWLQQIEFAGYTRNELYFITNTKGEHYLADVQISNSQGRVNSIAFKNLGYDVAQGADAIETLAELEIVVPAQQDGTFYTSPTGEIYTI